MNHVLPLIPLAQDKPACEGWLMLHVFVLEHQTVLPVTMVTDNSAQFDFLIPTK